MSGVTKSILEVGLSRRSTLLRPMVDGNTGSGFEYVLAKYDGPNAGSVVFYFGGAAANGQPDDLVEWATKWLWPFPLDWL
jgi:hypothetical protein